MSEPTVDRWEIAPMTEAEATEVSSWRYEGEYALYDGDGRVVDEVSDPGEASLSLHLNGELVGFCSFGRDGRVPGGTYDDTGVDIGIGLSPTHVGRGLGRDALGAVVALATRRFAGLALRATIADFNHRSRRTFEAHGFVEVEKFEGPAGRPFTLYERRATRGA